MRVFVTGGAGFIGSAVVKELVSAGHKVLGLSRSEKNTEALKAQGVDVHPGSLDDLESLKAGAAASDAVIHMAFVVDFQDYMGSCRKDREAIAAMAEVLAGSNKPLIMTSGTLMLPQGRFGTEDDLHDSISPMPAARGQSEVVARSFAAKGVRTVVMRLPPTNHGDEDKGFITMLINTARAKGVSAYVGDGQNRWPAVHRLDTAVAYRLALEKATAGSTFHVAAEEGVKTKDIAEAIGKQLGVPVESKPESEIQSHFGFVGLVFGADNPVSSKKTQDELGWEPKQCTLLEDLQKGTYFQS